MSAVEERPDAEDETGYGAAIEGDREGAPDPEQRKTREPATEEEAEQDNYANTDDQES